MDRTHWIVTTLLCGAVAAGAQTTVQLKSASGDSVGSAVISPAPSGKGVQIALDVNHLPPGEHAIHVHQNAKCEPPQFTTAGGHFNPDKKKHGSANPEGPHAGDIPDFTVDADGTSKMTIVAPNVTYSEGPHSIFSNGGTALMIHASADDLKSDPAGNAGARIACGVIAKP